MAEPLRIKIEVDTKEGVRNVDALNVAGKKLGDSFRDSTRRGAAGMDSMTGSMLKGVVAGNLIASTFERVLAFAKEYTIEAAKYAARTDTLRVVTDNLARVNGFNAQQVQRQVQAVRALGITEQEAFESVNKMIFANLNLAKATDLARLAQDAAVIAGKNSSETLAGLVHGITTQQTDVLRTYGISVNFEQEFIKARQQMNRDLTETEKRNIALQVVLSRSSQIAGTYEAAMDQVGKKMTSLPRYFDEAKSAIGQRFKPILEVAVDGLTNLAKWAQKNADVIAALTHVVLVLATAGAILKLPALLFSVAAGFTAITTSLAANPYGLALLAIASALAAVYDAQKRWDDYLAHRPNNLPDAGVLERVAVTAAPLTNATARAFLATQDAIIGKSPVPPKPKAPRVPGAADTVTGEDEFQQVLRRKIEQELLAVKESEQLKLNTELRKKQLETNKAAHEFLRSAQGQELDGLRRAVSERQKFIDAETTIIDEKRGVIRVQLSQQALDEINLATRLKIVAAQKELREEQRKQLEEAVRQGEAERAVQRDLSAKRLQDQLAFQRDTIEIRRQTSDAAYAREGEAIRQAQERELRGLDEIQPRTIQQRIALLEARKEIELRYIGLIEQHEIAASERQTQREIADFRASSETRLDIEVIGAQLRADANIAAIQRVAEAQAAILGLPDLPQHLRDRLDGLRRSGNNDAEEIRLRGQAQIVERVAAIEEAGTERRRAIEQRAEAQRVDVSSKTRVAEGQAITSHYQGIYDSIKRQAEGTWDHVYQSGRNAFEALGDTLKTAILTAIKGIVTSQVAAQLTRLITGANVTFAGGPGGGSAGGALAALGLGAPSFGSAGAPGGTGGFAGPVGLFGGGRALGAGPGGTPPFLPGNATAGSSGGNAGSIFGGGLGNLKNFFGFGSQSVQLGAGRATTTAGLGGKLTALGKSDAALLGGGALAFDGLRRGGLAGLAETTAGGALIGFKFGGPIGAAIGAGIGFAAGFARLFVKGRVEKVQDAVKKLYGLTIDKALARRIDEIARQSFGGNIATAIRSEEVVKTLQLYAQATGQSFGISNQPRGALFTQSAGAFRQSAGSYENGQGIGFRSAFGSDGSIDRFVAAGAPGSQLAVTLSLDAGQTTRLWEGEAVRAIGNNPAAVSAAQQEAALNSAGRRELANLAISPGNILS